MAEIDLQPLFWVDYCHLRTLSEGALLGSVGRRVCGQAGLPSREVAVCVARGLGRGQMEVGGTCMS
jgi:hypothetical protein